MIKCLSTILNLMESVDSNNHIPLRIRRSFPPNVLKNILLTVYKQFKENSKFYSEACFNKDDIPINPNNPETDYEFIIEIGFLVYHLILQLIENKKSSDNNQEDEEFNEYLKEFSENFKKGNIIGEFSKLGTTLIKTGFAILKGK